MRSPVEFIATDQPKLSLLSIANEPDNMLDSFHPDEREAKTLEIAPINPGN